MISLWTNDICRNNVNNFSHNIHYQGLEDYYKNNIKIPEFNNIFKFKNCYHKNEHTKNDIYDWSSNKLRKFENTNFENINNTYNIGYHDKR